VALKSTSARERSLEALKQVLLNVGGIKTVVRHGESETDIADSQMPAIVLLDKRAKYKRFNSIRKYEINYKVDLVLIARAKRTDKARFGDVGTIRELFSHTVVNTLIHNPQLNVQLEDEDEADNHCNHVGDDFDVVHEEDFEFPYAVSTVSFNVKLIDTLDDRPLEDWTDWVVDITPADEDGEADSDSTLNPTDTFTGDGIKTITVTS